MWQTQHVDQNEKEEENLPLLEEIDQWRPAKFEHRKELLYLILLLVLYRGQKLLDRLPMTAKMTGHRLQPWQEHFFADQTDQYKLLIRFIM